MLAVTGRHLAVLFSLLSLAGCSSLLAPGMYTRDVTVRLTGPSEIAVGQSVQLSVSLVYSDGEIHDAPSAVDAVSLKTSDPAIASVAKMPVGPDRAAIVTGIAPGDVTITATPGPDTTGTGARAAGTLAIRVVK